VGDGFIAGQREGARNGGGRGNPSYGWQSLF
jgi:hypothetical protein